MKISDFIKKAANRGGIQESDEALNTFLSSLPEDIQVPDNVATAVQSLMNEEEAKVNPKLKNHFRATALDSVDSKYLEIAEAKGFTEEQKAALKAETNTFKKGEMVAEFTETNAKSKFGKGNSEEAQKQIAEAQKAVKDIEEKYKNELETAKNEFEAERFNSIFLSKASDYTWQDAYSDVETRNIIFDTKVRNKLNELGAKAIRDGKEIKLVNANDNELPFTHNNQSLSFKDVTDMVMQNFIKTGADQPERHEITVGNKDTTPPKSKSIQSTAAAIDQYLEAAPKA